MSLETRCLPETWHSEGIYKLQKEQSEDNINESFALAFTNWRSVMFLQ